MVIDDDDIGFGGALTHAGDEALVVSRTGGAQTRLGGRRDLFPERQILRKIFQLGAVAGVGACGPFADDGQKDRFGPERCGV